MKGNSFPLELLINHPTFEFKKENDAIIYHGTLDINADQYELEIKEITTTKHGKEFQIIKCKSDNNSTKFEQVIEGLRNNRHVSDISTYVAQLEKTIRDHSEFPKNLCSVYRRILNEYSEFTKFFIDLNSCYISRDLSSIKASSLDEQRREHAVEFGVDFDEDKDIFYFKHCDLPVATKSNNSNIVRSLDKKSSSLIDLYNSFLGFVEGLQSFFDLMDTIDGNSDVIEPVTFTRKSSYRRIWLGDSVYVIITVQPFNINTCPNFAFLGPDKLVNEYRDKLNKNLCTWDNNSPDIFQEILRLLGIENFPRKQCINVSSKSQSENNSVLLRESTDCSICFCFSIDDKLPEVTCNNDCCKNVYHKSCLYEWLLSIDSKKFFSEIQGPCPNCEKMISCPIPE